MPKKIPRYKVKEKKRGGKRWRFTRPVGTKSEAQQFAKAMRKIYGDRFVYRVVKVK